MIKEIYNYGFIPLAKAGTAVARKFNEKLDTRETGAAASIYELRHRGKTKPRIWFHASSMGEFEQAKPVIELIRESGADVEIIASFFSPSGYENQKNYSGTNLSLYLPQDSPGNAREFIAALQPDTAVFVRYDIWLNYIAELKKQGIPSFLICATAPGKKQPSGNPFLRSYYKKALNMIGHIFTAGSRHSEYFREIGVSSPVTSLSDTRFDHIIGNVEQARTEPVLPEGYFGGDDIVLVAGSSWQPGEEMILTAARRLSNEGIDKLRIIFAPHEPTADNVARLHAALTGSALLSEILSGKVEEKGRPIIVDSIGKLLRLYQYADAAYIGGAFGKGVHSVTEPAGYGVPLAAGPKMQNSPDAVALRDMAALQIVRNAEDMYFWLKKLLTDRSYRDITGKKAKDYVYASRGSSSIIAGSILKSLSI